MGERSICGCIKCYQRRARRRDKAGKAFLWPGPGTPGWNYACETCGNKRCPHHSDHKLACTGSNEPGQPGSDYT